MSGSLNTVNYGDQIISYDYRQDASSALFNRIMSNLLPHGIYYGGQITRISNTIIEVAPLVCFIKSNGDPAENISIRMESRAPQTINCSKVGDVAHVNTTLKYIVLRFGWNAQEDNYVDFRRVAWSSDPANSQSTNQQNELWPDDIILGSLIFEPDGVTGEFFINSTPGYAFDLTRRQDVFLPDAQNEFTELRVQTSITQPKKVYVSGGIINTSKGRKNVVGGDYPAASSISDTTAFGRIDIVYVDENGNIGIEEGVASASPAAPAYGNKKVLAQIQRGAGRTDIKGPDILVVNVTRQGSISAKDFPIDDVGGIITATNIEDALQELATQSDNADAHAALDYGAPVGTVIHGIEIEDLIS